MAPVAVAMFLSNWHSPRNCYQMIAPMHISNKTPRMSTNKMLVLFQTSLQLVILNILCFSLQGLQFSLIRNLRQCEGRFIHQM